jgi:hypothetical protein
MPHDDNAAKHAHIDQMTETMMRELLRGKAQLDQCGFCLLMDMASKAIGTVMLVMDDSPEVRASLPAELMERALRHRDLLLERQRAGTRDGRLH